MQVQPHPSAPPTAQAEHLHANTGHQHGNSLASLFSILVLWSFTSRAWEILVKKGTCWGAHLSKHGHSHLHQCSFLLIPFLCCW